MISSRLIVIVDYITPGTACPSCKHWKKLIGKSCDIIINNNYRLNFTSEVFCAVWYAVTE